MAIRNIFVKCLLKLKQKSLMRKHNVLEQLQTEYSHDEKFYHYAQCRMDDLDEQDERIRWILERRWKE